MVDPSRTIIQAIAEACTLLDEDQSLLPRLEAETLLAFVLDKPRSYLLAWPERSLSPELLDRFRTLVRRRRRGEPHAYLTGLKEFWSLSFKITPATLVPRPETELLVERALQLIPVNKACEAADLGTGCGAIAAALASERSLCRVHAVEASAGALSVAQDNFTALGLNNVTSYKGDWCHPLSELSLFDIIVSNPPYIRANDPHLKALSWEPREALISPENGLQDIRHIVDQAFSKLLPGGYLVLEHGFDQGEQVRALLSQRGFIECRTHCDLNGLERISEGRHPM